MNIAFTDAGWEDYLWFQQYQPQLLKRMNELIKDAKRTLFKGIGKPEPLKRDLRGCWSRRITDEHRRVYKIEHEEILIRHHQKINFPTGGRVFTTEVRSTRRRIRPPVSVPPWFRGNLSLGDALFLVAIITNNHNVFR